MTFGISGDRAVGLQGCYAGAVSRLVAFVVDVLISLGLITLGFAGVSYALNIFTGHSIGWRNHLAVTIVVLVGWLLLYFAYPWAASGKTPGMALLGIRVVKADGTPADAREAIVRALTLPFSLVFCFLGCVGILVQRERRALHDLIAGTAVVYSWDARAARLRFLARRAHEMGPVETRGLNEPVPAARAPLPLPSDHPAPSPNSEPVPAAVPTVEAGEAVRDNGPV